MTQPRRQTKLEDALDAFQAARAAQGDVAAFDLLYRRWHPRLLRFARRLTGHPDDARDVLQDAALTMARDIHKLRDPNRFAAWAYVIIRRRTADYIGKAVKRRTLAKELQDVPSTKQPVDDLSLRQALSRLPETDRLMLELFYLEELRGSDIAAALGVPLGTVKSRLFAARARLKSIYETPEGDIS